VYAYASLDPEELTVKPFDNWADIENSRQFLILFCDAVQ